MLSNVKNCNVLICLCCFTFRTLLLNNVHLFTFSYVFINQPIMIKYMEKSII